MQRTNTLKVEYAVKMKFILGKWLWGWGGGGRVKNTSEFTHVHCWTSSMWTTSRVCAVAFKLLRPLPVGRRRPINRQCLKFPNIILLTTSSIIWDKLVPLWLLTWLRLPTFDVGTRLLSDHWFGLSRFIRSLFAY